MKSGENGQWGLEGGVAKGINIGVEGEVSWAGVCSIRSGCVDKPEQDKPETNERSSYYRWGGDMTEQDKNILTSIRESQISLFKFCVMYFFIMLVVGIFAQFVDVPHPKTGEPMKMGMSFIEVIMFVFGGAVMFYVIFTIVILVFHIPALLKRIL